MASTSLRFGCGQRLGAVAGGVLAAQEAIDDAILEADQPRGAVVVLREHAGDADKRQRALALAGVEMAIRAGDGAAGQLRRFVRRVGEDAIAPLDLIGELGGRASGRWSDPAGSATPSPSSCSPGSGGCAAGQAARMRSRRARWGSDQRADNRPHGQNCNTWSRPRIRPVSEVRSQRFNLRGSTSETVWRAAETSIKRPGGPDPRDPAT